MTELLAGEAAVRVAGGLPGSVRTSSGWRAVEEVVSRWRVETDWWRRPVRRDYFRCLLSGGECVELFVDLDTESWSWSRRYD